METRGNRWIEFSRHVAVALGYALGFALLRQVSFTHWLLFAGLRLGVLLLTPRRFWPALAVGEFVPLLEIALSHRDDYGSLWSLLYVIPPIALSMPLIELFRRRFPVFDQFGKARMVSLLACALACSLMWTLINLTTLSETRFPANYPQLSFSVYAARWVVGNFLGVLTIVPALIAVRELLKSDGASWRSRAGFALFIDLARFAVPCFALLVGLDLSAEQESLRQAVRIAMFLPVVILAVRHGWHGAALGGSLASVAIVLTMPERNDTGILQVQTFMAFAITTMLLLGDRIAILMRSHDAGLETAQVALAVAQRNLLMGEVQLRHTSSALELVREGVQSTYGQLLDRLRHMVPEADERDYRMRAAVAQQQLFRLADSLHPVLWRDMGLAAALRQGAIARALDEAGIGYWCYVRQDDVRALSEGAQAALYRSICDVAALQGSDDRVVRVNVQIRSSVSTRRGRWIVARIDGLYGQDRGGHAAARENLVLRLSATGLGLDATKDRVSAFAGQWRERRLDDRHRISFLMWDQADTRT